MGSSTLCHLALRGVRPLGLEQFSRGHDRGSSHGQSRVIRTAYFEHDDYVPLLLRARAGWMALEQLSGRRIVHETGLLIGGPRGSEVVSRTSDSAKRFRIDHSDWTAAEVTARFPMFAMESNWVGYFEPTAGFARPEQAVFAALEIAEQNGATVRESVAVRSIEERVDGVVVTTESAELHADRVVVTAGAWSDRLAPWPRAPIRVTRQVIAWIDSDDAHAAREGTLPTFCLDAPEGFLYGCPVGDDQTLPAGLKVARHVIGTIVDPNAPRIDATESECLEIAQSVKRRVPGCAGPVGATATCLYSNSPDSHFMIGARGERARIFVASGFSGHGFKFMPVVGEAMADFVTMGTTTLPLGFLSPKRFLTS